jgi:predicted nucleotide-binding protein (sugar kinase/HSP70/actin superfamily)
MTEYNAFIHYNIENNIWEEEMSAAKNRVKQLHKAHEKLLKQWKAL